MSDINLDSNGIISGEQFGTLSVGNITLNSSILKYQNQFGVPSVLKSSQYPILSDQVQYQLPAFVREDHGNFIDFMEAYYEWMDNYRNTQFDIYRLLSYQDIDSSIDVFTEQFFKEFLLNIPRNILADKALVLKHIKEFYRAKGTEKSYKFFFRILFNIDVDFYYPRIDILKVSDGKWIQNKTLRVRITSGNAFDLVGRKVRGVSSSATAFVEQVQAVQLGYIKVYELFLNRSSISGIFLPEEDIVAIDSSISGIITPIVSEIKIEYAGEGYSVGDDIEITGVGFGATAKVQSVNASGGIKKIKVTNFGGAYTETPTAAAPTGSLLAVLHVETGSLCNYPGYFLNEDGQISSSKYIHDGKYYQQFSYVVFVNESIDRYRDALKRMIHPAGLALYGGFRSQQLISAGIKIPKGLPGTILTRIHEHVKDCTIKSQLTHVNIIHDFDEAEQSFKLGPSYRSIQRDKFYYKPFERKDVSTEMSGNNSNYWGDRNILISQFANQQIKDFGHLIIKDIHEKPWTKINIMPEPILKNSDETGIISEENFGIAQIETT